MMGGMICPPVEAAASIPAACAGLYPSFFIIGMVNEPVVTVFAIALPEIDPIAAEAITEALAGPPRDFPAAAKDKSISIFPAPVTCKNAPNNTKLNTAPAAMPMGAPYKPAPVNT